MGHWGVLSFECAYKSDEVTLMRCIASEVVYTKVGRHAGIIPRYYSVIRCSAGCCSSHAHLRLGGSRLLAMADTAGAAFLSPTPLPGHRANIHEMVEFAVVTDYQQGSTGKGGHGFCPIKMDSFSCH